MASTVLAASAATMSLTFMRTSWKSPFLRPAFGATDVDEDVADRGAGLVGDLQSLELLDLGDVEVLARHDLRGLADIFDHRDGDEAAFVVSDDERLARIGAQVDLPRHHLLHGEIAGGHGEFLELDAALLQQPRLQQIVGRHSPDVGLIALPDGGRALPRGTREREAGRQRGGAGAARYADASLQRSHCLHVRFLRETVHCLVTLVALRPSPSYVASCPRWRKSCF